MPQYYCSSCSGEVAGPRITRCPHCTSFFGSDYSTYVYEHFSQEEIEERAANLVAYNRSPEGLAEAKERAQKQVESDTWNKLNNNLGWLSMALYIATIICWVYGYRNFVSGAAAIWCVIVIVFSIIVSLFVVAKTLDIRSNIGSYSPNGGGLDSFAICLLTLPALLMLYLYITHFVPNLKTPKLEWLSPFSDALVTTSNVLRKDESEKGLLERQQTSKPSAVVAESLPEAPASKALLEKKEIIIVREAVLNRNNSYTLTVDRVDYNQKGMNFIIAGDAGAATANFIIENKDKRILVTYVMADGCAFCIYKAEFADKVEPIPIAKAVTPTNKSYEFKYNIKATEGGGNGEKVTIYYDSGSLRKIGDSFEINAIFNYENGDRKLKNGVSYKSEVQNRAYYCLDNTYATKTVAYYDGAMGTGTIVSTFNYRNPEFKVIPEKSANSRFIKDSNYCN